MKNSSNISATMRTARRLPNTLSRPYTWSSDEAKTWVVNFATRTCSFEQTRALVMIGSIVRPSTAVNDVDLLYVYDKKPFPYRDHPLDVDIRAFPVSAVLERFQQKHDLIIWALEFGHLLCERHAFWSKLLQRFRQSPVLPSPETALDRAIRAERRLADLEELGDLDAVAEQRVSALTHRAWFQLLSAGVLPASRSELPAQLREIRRHELAAELERTLRARTADDRAQFLLQSEQ
jgi:hypothetical protein